MRIDVVGQGPDLVLIHGWALQGAVFEPLVQQLAAHCTLHVVDLPGHGGSRGDTTPLRLPFVVNAIAAATPPAVWCGWSLGGLFALHAAATLPKVRGLAMIASTPRFVRAPEWPHGMEETVLEQFGTDLATAFATTVDRFLALDMLGTDPRGAPATALRGLRQRLIDAGAPPPVALQQTLHLLTRTDLRGSLPGLARPSLWMAGQRDRLVPPAAMQAAAALAPAAQMLTIAHGGHAPFLGHAEAVAAALQQFVAGLSPADGGQ